ncbi:lambda exonuclease family protein [Pseudomonas sp. Irchel 3F3]|uniref:lambda exonuclease family protein n=1 Tax=Pseudomonas sp. Irchel 3F3 TaxID=2009000 RepID=UPI000BA4A4D6|nr:lambda exonuclease family protein [Pseudomonas sp. Irchel 3F3]
MNRLWHDIEQNTEVWQTLRTGKATASNFACFMANDGKAFGEPAKKYALQLALEQLTGRKAEFGFKNADTDRGHEQEPVARMLYEDERFVEVTNGGFYDCGDYGDSPDGLIGDDGVIEIKSVIASVHYDTLRRGSFDPSYRWQLVGHLDCSGRDWVDFISYCSDFPESGQLIVYRQDRDDFKDELPRLAERRAQFLELVAQVKKSIEEGLAA